MRKISLCCGLASLWAVVAPGVQYAAAQDVEQAQLRPIPGITADDAFPMACVSCHTVLPDGTDVRLSTLMRSWTQGADSSLLAKARDAAPSGMALAGKHPAAEESLSNIPAGCLTCHGSNSTLAPPFSRLLHRIHLVGGEANHFITMFRGECTYCHKLDSASGAWSIPSGGEPGS